MGPRRKARQAVLEALYAFEAGEYRESPEILQEVWDYCHGRYDLGEKAEFFGEKLFRAVLRNKVTIDELIKRNLQNWQMSRVALVDRNILRMGVCEIVFFAEIPRKVTIDESIELAKKYSTKDSGRFVNGVLDNITESSLEDLHG